MKIYLVGGAVRDQLLNYPSHERDWVVVGATPAQMLELGYRQVGRDFPVFIHPQSGEEYALARTERKTGHGYTGFTCFSSPEVTLEQDLQRRDLSINAMALGPDAKLIDPYQGQLDLQRKILRHVSPAFAEDPLRVLRVARFAARYHHLGFTVADETLALMHEMVRAGELDHLVPERSWRELQSALSERSPATFIEVLRACTALNVLLPEVDRLFGVPQPPAHHPEIDSGEHTLLALGMAAELSNDTEVRYAVLLHDVGKGQTPRQHWPRHHGHELAGVALVEAIGQRLRAPSTYTALAKLTAEFHLLCHRALELRPTTLLRLLEHCDAFRRPQRFLQFLTACEADARGRKGLEQRTYPQAQYLQAAYQAAAGLDIKSLVEQGLQGAELGKRIHQQRVAALRHLKQRWRPISDQETHDSART